MQIKFHGLSELLEREGIQPSSLILASEIKPAGHIVGKALQLEPTEEVFHLVRLRSGDGEPISIEDTYIPLNLIPDLQAFDFQIFHFIPHWLLIIIKLKISIRQFPAQK